MSAEGSAAIDAYLAGLPPAQSDALRSLRARIHARLPGNEEVISYAMPGHRYRGRMVAGYAAFARHLGFYTHSGGVVPAFAAELDRLGFRRSKSGVLFTPDRPLPDDLLSRLLAARMAEAGIA